MKKKTATPIETNWIRAVMNEPYLNSELMDREGEVAEVGLADDRADDRRNDVGDERVEDCGEGDTHHEGDGQFDQIPLQQEVSEFLEHCVAPLSGELTWAAGGIADIPNLSTRDGKLNRPRAIWAGQSERFITRPPAASPVRSKPFRS